MWLKRAAIPQCLLLDSIEPPGKPSSLKQEATIPQSNPQLQATDVPGMI